ncbi:MAG: OmpA family protein [Bacteroidota bacterium]|mgnify:CR=1 FL=1|nr:OmpA family protein [Bacteroidota bacterium]
MPALFRRNKTLLLLTALLLYLNSSDAQTNLLLNGGFEDVNTCTEYKAECGVEGWFYLKEVKAQMLGKEEDSTRLGSNSFGIYYNWLGYSGFTPVIGTILPCSLQKGNRYSFKGILSALLNPKLILTAGICLGEKFYVPGRPYAKSMRPDSIVSIKPVPNTNFYSFEYSFVANGTEKYLTFGTFVQEDIVGGKKKLTGTQTVSLVLDNFQLIPENEKEIPCAGFMLNKEIIYNYNFRHKEMDYSLYGKGELAITFTQTDSIYITTIKEPAPALAKPDTLKLGDVFFDFNKANLKTGALSMLETFFHNKDSARPIVSIYIEGHTDSIGTENRNLELSLQRCETVRQWLLQNNIVVTSSVEVHPFGKSKPIANNGTPRGRAMNRRVELIVFRKREK